MKHNLTMKRALNILLLLACSLLVACQGEKNNTPTPAKKSEPKASTAKTSLPREITTYGSKRVLKRLKNHKTLRYRSKRVPIVWLFN